MQTITDALYERFQDMTTLHALLGFIGPMLLADAALLLLACMLMGWRASRGLRAVAQGLSDLAEDKPVYKTAPRPSTSRGGSLM